MNDLMNLPSLILERLEENELILVRGGEDPDDKAPNLSLIHISEPTRP